MEKDKVIKYIKVQLNDGVISQRDLDNLRGGSVSQRSPDASEHDETLRTTNTNEEPSRQLMNLLYGIGTIITIIGVVVLLAQNWQSIHFVVKIGITLGIALIAYIYGLLLRSRENSMLSQILFTISAVLAPMGAFVLFRENAIEFTLQIQIIVASILFIIFGVAFAINKRNVLLPITIIFGSWTYFAFILNIIPGSYFSSALLKWAGILMGVSYILIAYSYKFFTESADEEDKKEKVSSQNILYGVGALAILLSGIMIGGIFDLVYIGIIFAIFYGSIFFKSRVMLFLGAFFLVAYIIKITGKYFANSIGWPLTLIGIGFLVIGVGYFTYYLNQKYLSKG